MIVTTRMARARTAGRIALLAVLRTTTQQEVARAIGSTQASVSEWGSGRRRPRPELREALARVYGILPESWEPKRL